MAEIVQEKKTGLKFAEEQLLRHGWEKGKGLGRSENGISEAVKVKIKSGKGGIGHKEGEQFSFHWWDHVFNKASSSMVVETGQNGVMVRTSVNDDDALISNKKPRKAAQAKSMLYGSFVKSATLLSGEEQPEKACDSDDSSTSEDEDQKLDLSSTTKLSDADLLRVCGGRTAHKGARHGLTMNAKLARLEQQEQEFINKYGKKNHTADTRSKDCQNPAGLTGVKEKGQENHTHEERMAVKVFSSSDMERNLTKKRKDNNGTSDMNASSELKKKKKKSCKEKESPEYCHNGVDEAPTHTSTHLNDKKKRKKKRSKMDVETADIEEITDDSKNAHVKQPQEGSVWGQQSSDTASKKKKKSTMDHYGRSPCTGVESSACVLMVTEEPISEAQVMDTQTDGQENKKKSKKKKRSKPEQKVMETVQFEESMQKKRKKKKTVMSHGTECNGGS